MSAIRATVDGLIVARTLRRSGVRPLFPRPREGGKVDVERATEVAAAVDAGLGLLPMAPTCLRRSMTLLRELARLDLAAALHVGVRHQQARIEAHAWVQVDTTVVNDDPTVFLDFVELPIGDLERFAPHLQ
ncbi:MAG: lasso peptide biosynthesis B2 protein [Acidimicrobiales bacterium]